MASAPRRTFVLADVHLMPGTPANVTDDLARFVTAHPGSRIVVAGDLFDLSLAAARQARRRAIADLLAAHPSVRAALASHLDRGGELWIIGGNHDADLGDAIGQELLRTALGASIEARARLRVSPWFFRHGGVHFEHGHLYDPDNAPAHPLVVGAPSLGVHFTEAFIAPTGAHRYLNANDGTPLSLFLSSFTWYGRRAPYVIYRYFHAATTALLQSGPLYRAGGEPHEGRARIEAFAEAAGLDAELVDAVLAGGARPTFESIADTFARLYLDRVFATVALGGGLAAFAAGARTAGAAAGVAGALLLGLSWAHRHDRYTGSVPSRLAASARRISETTGAKLVVFGHTHREALDAGYANTASFAFPRGTPHRPLLEIEGPPSHPRAVRRYWSAAAS